MPFSEGFDFLDLNTYTWMEYTILGVGLLILILLLVVWPICASKKRKKRAKKRAILQKAPDKLVFNSDDGETLIFEGNKAWFVKPSGKTELLNLVSGSHSNFFGKLVYANKEVRRTEVVQDGTQISKNASIVREYTTFDFMTEHEVRLGSKVYITNELNEKLKEEAETKRLEALRLAKEQAKEDAKKQAKLDKKQAKLAKKQAKKDKKKSEKVKEEVKEETKE